MKRSNNEGVSCAETGEGRTSPKGNGGGTAAVRTLRRDTASEVYPARRPLLSANQDATRLAMSPLRRQNPREEPGALAAHAGICAGGGEQSSSLPRPCRRRCSPLVLIFAARITLPTSGLLRPCSQRRSGATQSERETSDCSSTGPLRRHSRSESETFRWIELVGSLLNALDACTC